MPPARISLPLLSLLLTLVLSPAPAGADDAPAAAADLRLEAAPGSFHGALEGRDRLVTFGAERHEDGRVGLHVETDGLAVEAAFHPDGERLRLDGGGATVLPRDRAALDALARRLEADWSPWSQPLPLERHLLYRLVLALSEAPVGFHLDPLEVALPQQPAAAPAGGDACADDDVYIDCEPHIGEVCYCPDSDPICRDAPLGCAESFDCIGRCGPGCGADGAGAYTQDCADFDVCCRFHGDCLNPLGVCGGEYRRAVDDYFVPPNCGPCLGG